MFKLINYYLIGNRWLRKSDTLWAVTAGLKSKWDCTQRLSMFNMGKNCSQILYDPFNFCNISFSLRAASCLEIFAATKLSDMLWVLAWKLQDPVHEWFINYLITVREGLTVKFQAEGWNFCFRGSVHKSYISARSLKFYSKALANKVIKFIIIWLQIGKAGEVKGTSTLPLFSVTFSSG